MPYVEQGRRRTLDPSINAVPIQGLTAGELNYVITRLLLRWLHESFGGYAERALAVGVLETAKLEFYRRSLSPYEDRKAAENGDVYGEDSKERIGS